MKKCAVIFLILALAGAANAQYDPALFSVTEEKDCYVLCPAGDLFFCYCILYDGQPLDLHPSNVYMTIECATGCLEVCVGECLDKCGYLRQDNCHNTAGAGAEYCWFFRVGGCCEEAHISLHLKNDPNTFYDQWVSIKTPDFNCDGYVNLADDSYIASVMGTNDVCADLDCDGAVTAVDYALFIMHYNHSCEQWIGTEESTWGEIKSFYTE